MHLELQLEIASTSSEIGLSSARPTNRREVLVPITDVVGRIVRSARQNQADCVAAESCRPVPRTEAGHTPRDGVLSLQRSCAIALLTPEKNLPKPR